ncbi:hypothetical protein [Leptolyngbya ohadii]|uniref:hypothetical protein n=1 Tax=Leptolyngbya ohadii TaxID=1962290 RepID=UPI000B59CFEC|nr:hypothetical protein [Leptolyngbya ohadii]
MTRSRHVRTVHLTAPSEALVRRGAILLEDALHTASMPEEGGGRVFVVRSLQVGNIHSHQSSASLSLMIEQRLQQLRSLAVHGSDPNARYHPAVYFDDEIEPYAVLMMRLLHNQPATEWFWRSLIPEWQSTQPRSLALRNLLHHVSHTANGIVTIALLLQEIHTHHSLAALLPVLQEQDGVMLLRQCGWLNPNRVSSIHPNSPVLSDRSSTETIALPATWKAILREWVIRWGVEDARSVWLTAMALVAEKPARLLDPHLMPRIQSLLQQVQPQRSNAAAYFEKTIASEIQPNYPLESPDSQRQTGLLPFNTPVSEADLSISSKPDLALPQRDDRRVTIPEITEDSTGAENLPNAHRLAHHETNSVSITQNVHPSIDSLSNSDSFSAETPQLTAYAGLFFLLPLMMRLGISDFLAAYPEWIEFDLPACLLRYISDRLSISSLDPVVKALPEIAPSNLLFHSPNNSPPISLSLSLPIFPPNSQTNSPFFFQNHSQHHSQHHSQINSPPHSFIAPRSWWSLAAPPWIIRRSADTHASIPQTLWDSTGRFPLALWHDEFPETLRETLDEPLIQSESWLAPLSDREILLRSWLTAMRRWCRRYAQMGFRSLICRPGRVISTRTHIDVLFHHNQADLRLRKAGLDLDPGWLPWFGRVVLFHYLNGE